MKTRIILLLTTLVIPLIGLAQGWEWQNPRPQGNSLNDVDFVDVFNGWAVGDQGTILHTSDGGLSWELQLSQSRNNLHGVSFLNQQTGWAVGEQGTILHTGNGGVNWDSQNLNFSDYLRKVFFSDESNGWILGNPIFRTSDGGETWTTATNPGSWNYSDAVFLNAQTGWALLWIASVARTIDGGQTWEVSTLENAEYAQYMSFVDENHGWVLGFDLQNTPAIFRTVDGGITWTTMPTRPPARIKKFVFSDSLHGWGVGGSYQDGFISRTVDGGETWSTDYVSNESSLTSISVADEMNACAVGESGSLFQTINGGTTWQSRTQSVVSASLAEVAFADQQLGIAVGTRHNDGFTTGVILLTSDGVSWQLADTLPGTQATGVDLRPSGNGWVVGDNGTILRTINFGLTWTPQNSPSSASLLKVKFIDDLCGWAVGFGVILHTCNGGTTWEIQKEDSLVNFYNIAIVDWQIAWVSGNYGTVLYTSNGGLTWENRSIPSDWNCLALESICFFDDQRGFLAGHGYCHGGTFPTNKSYTTQDGGLTWIESAISFDGITFGDRMNGLALGYHGLIRTSDGGMTWDTLPNPYVSLSRHGLEFVGTDRWYAVGNYGAILRYRETTEASPEPKPHQPQTFALSVYPNPFNPGTTLQFDLPRAGRTKIQIFDITGRVVESLADRVFPQGQHRLTFDGTSLPCGLYFARIEGNGITATGKMMLIK